ncbi:MAG: hypothetical protein ACPLQP_08415, partial [Moorellaceae bacterium]
RQLRQDAEFAGKPAEAFSRALVWPARVFGASASQAGLEAKVGIRQRKKNLIILRRSVTI